MRLYHYTPRKSYRNIRKTGTLLKSTRETSMDAASGPGWYFTDLPPTTDARTIMKNNWGRNVGKARVGCHLEFEVDPSLVTRTGKHSYLVRNWNEDRISFVGGACPSPSDGRQILMGPAGRRVRLL